MLIERTRDVALRLMLADVVHEAALIRSTDPVRAAQLDAAADDLRAVIDEPDAEALTTALQNVV